MSQCLFLVDIFSEDTARSEVDRLAERFNIKRKRKTLEEELAEYEASCSSSHQNGNAFQQKLNKPYHVDFKCSLYLSCQFQIKFQTDVLPMIWACGLCGKGFAHDSMGDLFGPYYISSPRRNPEFLCTKETKKVSSPDVLPKLS